LGGNCPRPASTAATYTRSWPSLYLGLTCSAAGEEPRFAHAFDPESDVVKKMTLDTSQQKAMEHIFGNTVAVVQGPPGTGKSYVGVCAAKLILHQLLPSLSTARRDGDDERDESEAPDNHVLDNEVLDEALELVGPQQKLLVVCYTNHALDNFLQELVAAVPGLTVPGRLVRLGYRTKVEDMKRYVLSPKGGSPSFSKMQAAERTLNDYQTEFADENFKVEHPYVKNDFAAMRGTLESELTEARLNLNSTLEWFGHLADEESGSLTLEKVLNAIAQGLPP